MNYPNSEELQIPPQNIDAEKSALGSMLISEEAVLNCMDLLTADSFYKSVHQVIFKTVKTLFERGEAIDIVTVSEELRRNKEFDNIGGADYLTELVNSVTIASNVIYYAKIVKDKSLLRELIKVSSEVVMKSFQDREDVHVLLDSAEQKIFDIRQENMTSGFIPLAGIVGDTIEAIEKICNQDEEVSGLSTGFKSLDKKLSGLHKGNLIIVAGRPSMGKTSFGLNIARYLGLDKKIPVGIFSLEMSSEEVLMRILCSEAQVDLTRVRDGYVGSSEWAALTSAAGRIKESKIFIDDSPALTPLEMKARARRLKSQYPDLGVILVDYIQLMSAGGSNIHSRQEEISYISRSLKVLAKDIEIPVIVMSQLSRAPEIRSGDARPRLSDLRESGAIEQDADVVLFIYRPSYYKAPGDVQPDEENIAEIIIGKQRNGPVGKIDMLFQNKYTRFRDLIRKEEF